MALKTDLAKQIETYIKTHQKCETSFTQRLELAGKLEELRVYRLPTSLLHYSIKNGRFAAWYRELTSSLGRELDSGTQEDAERIRKLLLEQDKQATKVLKDDLLKVGQRVPGVTTFDGSLVNGNRRMAVFEELQEKTGAEKWRFLEVSILPPNTSERDVWRIEAGLQFSREEKLEYGPINRLLKFREGVEAGLTTKEIAATIYGGFTKEDIEEDLERLKLIDVFLSWLEKPGHYKTIEDNRWHEHFIDLRNFIRKEKNKGTNPAEINKLVKFAFDLIRNNISHWDLRDIGKIMNESASKSRILHEINTNPSISPIVLPKKQTGGSKAIKLPVAKGKEAPTIEVFYDSVEIAEAAEQSSKPALLLTRALTNLNGIDTSVLKSKDAQMKKLILDIEKIVAILKKKIS